LEKEEQMTTKTLKRLEKEYAQYIAKTRREAARKRRLILKRPAPRFVVLSRHVTTVTGGKAVWGKFRSWTSHADNARNLRAAIEYAVGFLRNRHIGTIVYVIRRGGREPIPVWEAKWGHDNLPFVSWKPNPAAVYWKRRMRG